jgi:hypothetical protein
VTANVVITANIYNLSIFNQLWLERHRIFTETELTSPENAFLPVVVQIETDACQLLVMPDRLQMTLKAPDDAGPALDKVCTIIRLLPETPYTALGLNAVWNLSVDEGDTVPDFTRRNFAVPHHPLYAYFEGQDARFGTYVSKSFREFRLRGDIKPVRVVPTAAEMIQLSFNFNLDLHAGQDNVAVIIAGVERWMEAFRETQTIADMLT